MSRRLAQLSEKKKVRERFASPDYGFARAALRPMEDRPTVSLLPKVSKLDVEEEDELITVLKEIIQHEKELEEAKIRLARQPDFNLMDAFQMIDLHGKGWLTAPQL